VDTQEAKYIDGKLKEEDNTRRKRKLSIKEQKEEIKTRRCTGRNKTTS